MSLIPARGLQRKDAAIPRLQPAAAITPNEKSRDQCVRPIKGSASGNTFINEVSDRPGWTMYPLGPLLFSDIFVFVQCIAVVRVDPKEPKC